jgi:hypothetical protein
LRRGACFDFGQTFMEKAKRVITGMKHDLEATIENWSIIDPISIHFLFLRQI